MGPLLPRGFRCNCGHRLNDVAFVCAWEYEYVHTKAVICFHSPCWKGQSCLPCFSTPIFFVSLPMFCFFVVGNLMSSYTVTVKLALPYGNVENKMACVGSHKITCWPDVQRIEKNPYTVTIQAPDINAIINILCMHSSHLRKIDSIITHELRTNYCV